VFILFASPRAELLRAACELRELNAECTPLSLSRHLIPATRNNSSAPLSAAERYHGYNVFPAAAPLSLRKFIDETVC